MSFFFEDISESYYNNKIINEIMYYINQSFLYVFEFIRNRQNYLSKDNSTSKIKNPFKIRILVNFIIRINLFIYIYI